MTAPVPFEPIAAAGPSRRLGRAAMVVAPATMVANVLAYAFNVVVSRALGPDGYGALGSLLGLVIVAGVPAVALQAVVARRVAVDEGAAPALVRHSLAVGGITTAVLLVASPAIAEYLRLEVAAAVWLAVALLPLAVMHASLGVLQGRERFAALAGVLVAASALRLAAGAVAVAVGGGTTAVLAATAVGTTVAACAGVVLVPVRGSGPGAVRLLQELARAGLGILALVVLANVDVLLARHHLSSREAGHYAVGALFAKAAFWAPQAVAVLVFPRLSRGGGDRVLRPALALLALLGLLLVVGAAGLGDPVVATVFGPRYESVGALVPLFTALGSTLAVAQLLVFDSIAAQRTALASLVAAAALLEILLVSVWLHDSPEQVVAVALAVALAMTAVGLVLRRSVVGHRTARRP